MLVDRIVVMLLRWGRRLMWNYDAAVDPQDGYEPGSCGCSLARSSFGPKHGLLCAETGTAADFKFCWVTDFPMYECE